MKTFRVAQFALFFLAALGSAETLRQAQDRLDEPSSEEPPVIAERTSFSCPERIPIEPRPAPPALTPVPAPEPALAELAADVFPSAAEGGPDRVLTGPEADAWLTGRERFAHEWTDGEGLGAPGFNAESCGKCHNAPVPGGAGDNEFNVILFPSQQGYESLPFPGNRLVQMRKIRDQLQDRRARKGRAMVLREIQTPSLQGLGLVAAIADESILANEDPEDADGDGVRGVARRVQVGPREEIGRFGWKARAPLLKDFVCLALAGEVGITAPDQCRGFGESRDDDRAADPEVSQEEFDALVVYVSNIAAPARAGAGERGDPQVRQGEHLFEWVGCATCHVPALETRGGMDVPLYSDLLLHDVLAEEADGGIHVVRGSFRHGKQKDDDEPEPPGFRTPPLWGVSKTAPYLHDGRAPTLHDAIVAHQVEAAPARQMYESLSSEDQEALVAFLSDL